MAEQVRAYAVEVGPVRAGEELDWARLEAHLRANIPGLGGPFSVLQFPNGSANLTYLVRMGDTELVVRRPPFGRLAPGAHDMRREFRAVDALSRHFDRAPRAYLFCDDHDVIGSDFLVVEYRRGVVVWDHVPAEMAHHDGAPVASASPSSTRSPTCTCSIRRSLASGISAGPTDSSSDR